VTAVLFNALRALGPAAERREIATVAVALRESGDQDVGRLLNYEGTSENWDRCCAIADHPGAHGFVALDLAVAFHTPAAFAELVEREGERFHPPCEGNDAGR
jgi:hypothetical protein